MDAVPTEVPGFWRLTSKLDDNQMGEIYTALQSYRLLWFLGEFRILVAKKTQKGFFTHPLLTCWRVSGLRLYRDVDCLHFVYCKAYYAFWPTQILFFSVQLQRLKVGGKEGEKESYTISSIKLLYPLLCWLWGSGRDYQFNSRTISLTGRECLDFIK